MAVFISAEPLSDCQIQVVEKDGEIHLVHNGHAFVKCRTGKNSLGTRDHMVEVHDIDGGGKPLTIHSIKALGWRP